MNNKRSKWCYASGCTGRDLCYTLVSLFLLTYIQYTNLVNTAQFLVLSVIIVLCRVWDAVNDPMMGTIISNTRTRFGKYRPWVLIGCIANLIFFVGMFTIRIDVGSNIDKLGWYNVAILGVCYLLWGMSFTMNDVSYWSLLPILSEGKKERDQLTTMVAIFASVGQFVAGGVVPMLTTQGNMIAAYRWIAIIFGMVFFVCQVMVFFFTHDNKEDKFMLDKVEEESTKEKSITLKDMFKILVRNKQLLVMALVVLLYTTASSFITALGQNFLYFRYGFEGDRMFVLTVIFAVGTIISQFFFPVLANKFKRMQIVKYSILVSVIGYLLFMLFALIPFGAEIGFGLLCFAAVLVFAGQGFFYMTMLIMLTNTIEYDEWKNYERNDAVTFSVRPFMVKLSSAIQQLIISVILVVCGLYSITNKIGEIVTGIDKGEIDSIKGVSDINTLLSGVGEPQMVGLTLCMTIIPALMLAVCYFVIKKKYIISEELYEQMTKEIKERG